MSVHYKFKSALSFDTITFDGLHISVRDLKKAILQQKQIGKATDFDLQITNAQSNEVYDDENVLIPKNSSLIVVRVPLTTQQKKNWEKSDSLPALNNKQINAEGQDPIVNRLAKTVDLANVDASEEDKIQAAITQSTLDYDPSNYLRIKGSNQVGELPANYRCYKCMQPGHWIKDCKFNNQQDAIEIKKSTGIPRSFMVPVEGPEVPGAMMTPTGHFAVPTIEHEARREPIRKPIEPAVFEKPQIPEDLLCGVCRDLLIDAVLIPCCGNSFCDECIRNFLLESEEHQCPDCKEKNVSPDTLIPNRFLRNSVSNFKNQTGYMRAGPPRPLSSKPAPTPTQQPPLAAAISQNIVAVPILDETSQHAKVSPPATPASPDNIEEPTVSPDDFVVVNEPDLEPPAPTSPLGSAIPTLQSDNVYPPPNQRHPMHHIPSRHPPNPNLCPQGEDQPHHGKDKGGGYMHKGRSRHDSRKRDRNERWRSERSGTPTVDERNNERYPNPITVHVSEPGMSHPMHHVNQSLPMNNNNQHNPRGPPMYPRGGGGNYMYPRQPFSNRGSRAPNMPYPYPPGPHMRGGPAYRGRPRAPFRSHSPNNNTTISTEVDPVEAFNRFLHQQDMKRHQHSRSRSPFSRSRSRTPRSPRRLRTRSPRSRSRTRASSRTRSHSRTPLRRRRTRSRSQFSLSRSSSRSARTLSRSPSRDRRDYSPRRRDYRSPMRPTSPIRYYSQKYKEEQQQFNNVPASRNGRGRYGPKPQDYYSQDYPRENERYDRPPGRDRDRERERFDRERVEKVERFERDRIDRGDRLESRVDRPDRGDRSDRLDRLDRFDRGERVDRDRIDRDKDRIDRDRERDRLERDRSDRAEKERGFERTEKERGFERTEKERGFERAERDRLDRDRIENRERVVEKDRDRDRDKDRERERSYSSYKRYDTFEGMREYDHPMRDVSRDWEKTRDRELEIREKDKLQAEYFRKREPRANNVEVIETLAPPGVNEEERDRVLIDLPVRSEPLEKARSPEKEKKTKEKKKKKKEDSDRKKKKKKLKEKAEKKEALEEGEIASDKPDQGDEETPVTDPLKDDLYGDLGANIDQFVVENYNKPIIEEKKEIINEKDVMLAPVPELSKWEKDEDILNQVEENKRTATAEDKQVTSEVLERAMNVITKKSVKPIEKKVEKKSEIREVKDTLDVRDPREVGDAREVRGNRDARDIREVRSNRDARDLRDIREVRESREVRDGREIREVRATSRDGREMRDVRDTRDLREVRESREPRDARDIREFRDVKERRSREREKDRRDEKRDESDRHSKDGPKSIALPVKTEYERRRSSSRGRIPSNPVTPGRISAKERLGAKVEDKVVVNKDVRGRRQIKIVDKVPKSIVRRERDHTPERPKSSSSRDHKRSESRHTDMKASEDVDVPEVKKIIVNESTFVPDYDKSELEADESKIIINRSKKRSISVEKGPDQKKIKAELDLKPSTEDSSPSSDESGKSVKKKKRKKHKKKKSKKRRHDSSSDSDSSDSSSPSETERKKKKHKHKSHKKSKKRKKSKK